MNRYFETCKPATCYPAVSKNVLMSNVSRGHSPVHSVVNSTRTFLTAHQYNSRPVAIVNTSAGAAEASPNYEFISQQNAGSFPCHHPINPHMCDCENRLQTFVDQATNWPAHRINATPREIVDAGFFYLGKMMLFVKRLHRVEFKTNYQFF